MLMGYVNQLGEEIEEGMIGGNGVSEKDCLSGEGVSVYEWPSVAFTYYLQRTRAVGIV